MDNKFQSSFIPKKPLIGADARSQRPPVNLFGIITLIIFILSLVAAGGTFFWVKLLKNQQIAKIADLQAARNAFDPDLIKDLKKVSTRITTAKDLLKRHIAVSNFFSLLQSITLKSVRYTSLSYTYDPKEIHVTIGGEAENFTAVALQSDSFGKSTFMTNPIITDLAISDKGSVTFQVNATIASSVFDYEKLVTPPSDTASAPAPTGQDAPVPDGSLITTPLNLLQQ